MPSLYELTNVYASFISHLEEMQERIESGELDPEVVKDTLDSAQFPIEEKVENIVKYMKSLEALAESKKAESKRLNESAARDLKKAEWFKNYMSDNLQKVGINKLQAGVFSLNFRKGSEVIEIDERQLPDEYWIVPDPEPIPVSKNMLKKLIKDGREIPGVSLIRKPDSLVVK